METQATDNRETPARNRYGYPPIPGECLCGHQFRMHRAEGDRHPCLDMISGREGLCDCALFEAAVR